MTPRSCPACARDGPFALQEEHRDRVAGELYRLYRCEPCGVVFSEPRRAVGPDWYEKSAPLRAQERRPGPEKDWRFQAFLARGLPPGKLLDVGCGDGGFLELSGRAGWEGVGFDYESRMVELARARGADAHAADFAAFARARRPGEFDAITLFDVLEHSPEPAELIGLVRPLLKKGGTLALTLPNASRPLPFSREEFDYPPHHFTRWSPEALAGFLERQGFAVEAMDSGRLRLSYLSDHIYFKALAPAALAAYKRLVFGRGAEGKTVAEAYACSGAGGALADPGRRQAVVDAGKAAMKLLTVPLAAGLWLGYAAVRPGAGEHLFAVARRRD